MPTMADELTAKYYKTESGITSRIFPDHEWAFVTEMNEAEPTNIVVSIVWISVDNNIVIRIGRDITDISGQCSYAGALYVDNVSYLVSEPEKVKVYNAVQLDCATMLMVLNKALKQNSL